VGDTLSELKASVEKLEQTIKDAKRNKRETGAKIKELHSRLADTRALIAAGKRLHK
jgi:peptidoglycan hydrolase CwlO-like protein